MKRWIQAIRHAGRVGEVVRCVTRVRNWAAVTRRYIGLGGGYPVAFVGRDGSRFDLHEHHDLVTAWIVYCRREYRPPSSAELIVDLGANIGLFAITAARAAPQATVVAIEPFPATADRFAQHVADNGLGNRIHCMRVAVAPEPGERWMDPLGPSQSRALQPGEAPASGVRVAAATLPAILDDARRLAGGKRIDFLKIDIEGIEHDIVPRLPAGALAAVAEIGMEYHPNGSKAELFAALAGHGLVLAHDRPFGANVGVAHFRRRA